MNDFSPRLGQIVITLLNQENPVSVKFLADIIGVSKRTVQRELEYLPSTLKKYNLSFHSKAGTGVWIEGENSDRKNLLSILSEDDSLDVSNRDERRKRLILELLKEREPQKLFYYADILTVSEATVSSDIDSISPWFKKFGISVIRKQGYGVYLDGSEKAYRAAMSSFIDENITSDTIISDSVYDVRNDAIMNMVSSKDSNNIYSLLDKDIIKRVISCIMSLNNSHIANLTDTSYTGLILHTTIAINRIMQNEIIEPDNRLKEKLENDKDYILAMAIASSLESEFDIKIPDIEISYICLHIKGSKSQIIDSSEFNESSVSDVHDLTSLVYDMIEIFDKETSYLLQQDDDFIRGLISHMQPTIVRLSNGLSIKNPLLEQIRKDYSEIYKKCEHVSSFLENKLGYKVPEEETGFLAVHFGAALSRIEDTGISKRRVKIGVVCSSGIGLSMLMKTRLEKEFKHSSDIFTYGKSDLNKKVFDDMDFFVSAINLDESNKYDVIYVGPLITDKNIQEISNKIKQYEVSPKKNDTESDFIKYLDFMHRITYNIKYLLERFSISEIPSDISFGDYTNILRDFILKDDESFDIVLSDILKRESLSSQVFSDLGFAIFHTRTAGVKNISFHVCIPDNHTTFTDEYFKNIRCIATMLIPQDEYANENSKILGIISELIVENKSFLDALSSNNKEKCSDIISFAMKQFLSDLKI